MKMRILLSKCGFPYQNADSLIKMRIPLSKYGLLYQNADSLIKKRVPLSKCGFPCQNTDCFIKMRIPLSKSGFPCQNADSVSTDINAFLSRIHMQTGFFICLSIPEKFLVFGIFVVDLSNFASCASIWSYFWIPQRPADFQKLPSGFF